jgi:capsular polysaccharide biosynthesis protein
MFKLFGKNNKKLKRSMSSADFGDNEGVADAPQVPDAPQLTFSARASLSSMAIERVRLARGVSYRMPSALAYSNMATFDEQFALHLARDVYSDRVAHVQPLDLVRLETATIYPENEYVVSVGLVAIEEQSMPWAIGRSKPQNKEEAMVTVNTPKHREEILQDTVIIARFGAWTWGHWLGELLPKIVVIEAAFPNRFFFAVPQNYNAPEWQNFGHSIAAYGVPPQRLVLLQPDRAYVLNRAWALTSIWSDHAMHPAAAELMRTSLRTPAGSEGPGKVALLRNGADQRRLENWDEIAALLSGEGYAPVDIAQLSFVDQVRTFRNADALFGTLGSGLTGLIYSPVGVAVTSVAPALFGERFFYALVVDRRGRYADVRGPIVNPDPNIPHRGSFAIDRAHVAEALLALKEIQ